MVDDDLFVRCRDRLIGNRFCRAFYLLRCGLGRRDRDGFRLWRRGRGLERSFRIDRARRFRGCRHFESSFGFEFRAGFFPGSARRRFFFEAGFFATGIEVRRADR